jgi:hypothetical protein
LKNICDIEKKSYPIAIAWFENDILNPASINDSVYSLIDLSDTYMQMQADSNQKSSMSSYVGALAQYKPHSLKEYVSRSNEWIKLLFNDKTFGKNGNGTDTPSTGYMLKQNNPNPFNVTTQMTYKIPETAHISIIVTNIAGEQVMEIDQNEQVEGDHVITLNFSGKPDGIYFIALIADHKDVCKIKAIKAN